MEHPPAPAATRAWLLYLGLLLCSAVYLPRLGAPLAWDDRGTIAFNQDLGEPRPLSRYLSPAYFSFSREQSWRPLATLSYDWMIRLGGRSPALLRLPGLLLHAANALLLLLLLRRCGLPSPAPAWATALFLLHPAHVETLLCVSFNEELLAAFGLLALLLGHEARRPIAAAAGLCLALLSKETGALGPPLAVLLDLCRGGLPLCRRRLRDYALYALPLALYLWLRFARLPGPAAGQPIPIHFLERAYYALCGAVTAARVLLLPVRLRLEYFAVPPASAAGAAAWIVPGALLAALLGLSVLRLWRRDRTLAYFLLWPLPFLLVTSNLLPTPLLSMRLMAERWLYLPLLGAAAVLGAALRGRKLPAAALLALWGGLAATRAADWSRESRLWRGLAEIYPWSAKVQEGLGEALFREKSHPEARRAFERALALRESRQDKVLARYAGLSPAAPGWESPSLYRWLGHAALRRRDLAAARRFFLKASALDPADGFTYRIMAYHLAESGRFEQARFWTREGLSRDAQDPFLRRLEADIRRRKLSFRADFDG